MWRLTASVGKAYRFATASELYQLVSTGATFTSPDLEPEAGQRPRDRAQAPAHVHQRIGAALAVSGRRPRRDHLAVFAARRRFVDALFVPVQCRSRPRDGRGVGARRNRPDRRRTRISRASCVTWLDARTIALSGRASATAPAGSAIGKFLPNIPSLRASFLATYRATAKTALSLAGRYSSKMYTTLDNSRREHQHVPGVFSAWFVMRTRG